MIPLCFTLSSLLPVIFKFRSSFFQKKKEKQNGKNRWGAREKRASEKEPQLKQNFIYFLAFLGITLPIWDLNKKGRNYSYPTTDIFFNGEEPLPGYIWYRVTVSHLEEATKKGLKRIRSCCRLCAHEGTVRCSAGDSITEELTVEVNIRTSCSFCFFLFAIECISSLIFHDSTIFHLQKISRTL